MPTLSPLVPLRLTPVCALFALAGLLFAADEAKAQSFLRRFSGSPAGVGGGAAPTSPSSAQRPADGRVPAASRPVSAAASPATGRGSTPSATPAKRASPAAPAVVRAGGAEPQAAVAAAGVVQAGRTVATADCRHCGRRGCNGCRPDGGRIARACNGRCDTGGCPAHCPVRPEQFGYYATQWRSWPGQGVRQVSHFDPATTPVVPPRSQLPTLDEEAGVGPEEDAGPADAEAEPEAAPPTAAPVSPLRGGDAPAGGPADMPAPAGAPVPDAESRLPDTGADDIMTEESGAALGAPRAAGAEAGAATPDAASQDAASVLLSPRRAAPARPTSAWRPATTPRGRRGEDVPANGPLDGDGAATSLPAGPAQPGVSATPGNPLRSAERLPEIDTSDRRPRAVAAEGWRPTRRGASSDASETNLRGVTANPGNPLR